MTKLHRRQRRQRPSLVELTAEELRELTKGYAYFEGFHSQERMREAWQRFGQVVLADWVDEFPGTRPFGWWLFEGVPTHGERRTTKWWTAECEANRAGWLTHGILQTHTQPPSQEMEWEYLDRNGLLSASEKKAVGMLPRAEDWIGFNKWGQR